MVTDNCGAFTGDRTRGLAHTKGALVPLSYEGEAASSVLERVRQIICVVSASDKGE